MTLPDPINVRLPADDEALAALKSGDIVYLSGVLYTAREAAYKRCVDEGVPLPPSLTAATNANFHCSPAAAPDGAGGYTVGAVTATASFRFAKWMDRWMELAATRVIIGKAGMSEEVYRDVFVPHRAVYLTTVGYGTGALLGRGVKRVVDVHWLEDLGIAQAMWVLEVADFGPFIVDADLTGRSLFAESNRRISKSLEKVYAGLKPPALGRVGETTSRDDEVI
jgi:L(+)-tartrate dehydratase beta subunit